jgi:hypothetical protein
MYSKVQTLGDLSRFLNQGPDPGCAFSPRICHISYVHGVTVVCGHCVHTSAQCNNLLTSKDLFRNSFFLTIVYDTKFYQISYTTILYFTQI